MSARRIALATLLVAGLAFAEEDPNVERGVKASKAYSFGGVDTVNVFNGNVNLRIPLGLTYRVGGTMSYSLGAAYSTNTWEIQATTDEICRQTPDLNYCKDVPAAFSHPSPYANAGFGWLVTLGHMFPGFYLAPDGGHVTFEETLHANNPYESAYSGGPNGLVVRYSRDGSYLRRRDYANRYELDFPNGHVHHFDAAGRLTKMVDPYGNWVQVEYGYRASGPHAGRTQWRIHDSTGRQHFVYFRQTWSYMHDTDPDGNYSPTIPWLPEMVDYVELAAPPAPNGAARTAIYQFIYNSSPDTSPVPLSRRSVQQTNWDDETATFVYASMLTGIQIPEGLAWTMAYEMGNGLQSHVNEGGASGNIVSLTMPAAGRIDWTYRLYRFPAAPQVGTDGIQSWNWNAGVASKKVFNNAADTAGSSIIEETEYRFEDLDTTYPEDYQSRLVLRKHEGNVINGERHYFTTCRVSACNNRGEYGLPLARLSGSGPFLSTEFLEPTVNAQGQSSFTVRRSTYLEYEMDGNVAAPLGSNLNMNRRVKRSRTVFEDGTVSEQTSSRFDGFGNYRKTTSGGTFPGENTRHVEMETNPGKPDFVVDSAGVLQTAGWTLPGVSDPWILHTYDKQTVSEPSVTQPGATVYSTTTACFDSTGFLTSVRKYRQFGANPAAATNDLLAVNVRDAAGNVVEESQVGGDNLSAPVPFVCGGPVASPTYRVQHSYQHGALARSWVAAAGLLLTDNDIDPSSSLVRAAWSGSSLGANGASNRDGLQTILDYDHLGRLVASRNPAGPVPRGVGVNLTYLTTPPKIELQEKSPSGAVLRTTTTQFDALGRVVREWRSMPSNVIAQREQQYDDLGRMISSTQWGFLGTLARTTTTYDIYGRPVTVTPPDQQPTTLTYDGPDVTHRTVNVRTGGAGMPAGAFTMTPSTHSEHYDRHGRLVKVIEPAPAPAQPATTTEYTYDVGDRLIKVCANASGGVCGQQRLFNYDNAGLLMSEQHPELGTNGQGTTSYEYDARGLPRRRTTGAATGPFDLGFTYDGAGRLTKVREMGGSQVPLKEFDFAVANAPGNLQAGKLTRAIRHNRVQLATLPYNVQVVEEFQYGGVEGAISATTISDYVCSVTTTNDCSARATGTPSHSFVQTTSTDIETSQTTTSYPLCVPQCTNSSVSRVVTSTASHGWLTGVTWTGAPAPSQITYYPSGALDTVTHGNSVIDKQEVDETQIRPLRLTTTSARDAAPCTKPSFTTQPQSVTVVSGDGVILTANSVGQDGDTTSYQWYRGLSGDTSTPVGTNFTSFAVTPTTTTSYWVRATNICGSIDSNTATITICGPPTISSVTVNPTDKTITRGENVTITVAASSATGTLSYEWKTVIGTLEYPIQGAISATLQVTPSETTRYRVYVLNGCTNNAAAMQRRDIDITVHAPPTAPQNVVATFNGSQTVVSWSASSSTAGILRYEVDWLWGSQATAVAAVLPPALSVAIPSSAAPPGQTSIYRVRAVDTNVIPGDYSTIDFATAIGAPADVSVGAAITAAGITQLRTAIDAVRAAAGLSQMVWPSPTGVVAATHLLEMQLRLNEARVLLGASPVQFLDPVTVGGPIRASHFNTLREATR
ncbi:MAG TPA: hypothetical protein VF618_02875 [Thermoanaerobaculia bacterium]